MIAEEIRRIWCGASMSDCYSREDVIRRSSLSAAALLGLRRPARSFPATGGRQIIDLSRNENPLGPAPEALAAIDEQLHRSLQTSGINRYPDFLSVDIRLELSKKYLLEPFNTVPTCGIGEAINMAAAAYLRSGSELVMADPAYPLVEERARSWGATVIKVPLNKDHRYDLNAMLRAVNRKTKLVYINNPHNPTGTMIRLDELVLFLIGLALRNPETVVLMDEAYADYVGSIAYPNTVLLMQIFPLVVCRTLSKAHGLAGLRAGYILAGQRIASILDATPLWYLNSALNSKEIAAFTSGQAGWKHPEGNVNRLAERGLLASLGAGQAHLQRVLDLNRQSLQYFYEQFDRLRLKYIRSQANFVLLNLGTADGFVIRDRLAARGVLVQAGGSFGLRYKNWLRVSTGTAEENHAFIVALEDALKQGG